LKNLLEFGYRSADIFEETSPEVNFRRFPHECGRSRGVEVFLQALGHGDHLCMGRPTGPQFAVDLKKLFIGEPGKLGRPQEVFR
jgi:hypothetical protein